MPSEKMSMHGQRWNNLQNKRTFLSTVVVSFAIVGLQLVQGVLLARLLGPQGRGEYATAVFWSHFLMFIGLFGGTELLCRYANDKSYDRMALRRSALSFGLITGFVTMLLAMFGSVFLIPEAKSYIALIGAMCALSVLAQNVILVSAGVDRASESFSLYNQRRIFAAAALPVLILVCLPLVKVDVTLVCMLYVVGSYSTMWLYLRGVDRPLTGPKVAPTKQLFDEAKPYALSMLVAELFERLDMWLVLWLAPIVLQGYYAMMVPVVYPLIVIPNTLGIYLFNAGAKAVSRMSVRVFLRTLLALIVVQGVMLIGFWIVLKPFMGLYGPEFYSAIPIALWLAPASAIKGIVQGLESFLRGLGRPKSAILCRIVAASILVAMSLILFKSYSVQAVAMASLASQVVCFVWISCLVIFDLRHRQASNDHRTPTGSPVELIG
jgi:O-antigen/teichoic acid export membrane protein